MHKADEAAPLSAMLHVGERTLPIRAPDLVEVRLQPDTVFVDRQAARRWPAGTQSRLLGGAGGHRLHGFVHLVRAHAPMRVYWTTASSAVGASHGPSPDQPVWFQQRLVSYGTACGTGGGEQGYLYLV